jgi:hypothetical protein
MVAEESRRRTCGLADGRNDAGHVPAILASPANASASAMASHVSYNATARSPLGPLNGARRTAPRTKVLFLGLHRSASSFFSQPTCRRLL